MASGPVVNLALEEKRSEVRKLFEKMGATSAFQVFVHIGSAQEKALDELRKVIIETHAVYAIIDPLQRLVRMSDPNNYSEVSLALEPLMATARDTGCHIMLIHHANKGVVREGGDSILGSTALLGIVDCALIMKRTETYRTIESIQPYCVDLPRTILASDPATVLTTSGASLEEYELAEYARQIVEFLTNREPTPETDIKDSLPTPHRRGLVSKALRGLVLQGRVMQHGNGKRGDPYLYSLAVGEASGVSGLSGSDNNGQDHDMEKPGNLPLEGQMGERI